jgi:5'-deoxynucleotidase YfbR-like HD superfamily hydrolase
LAVSFEAGRLAVKANCPAEEIRDVKLLGLLHDAHEYLCGDVTRPLKEVLGDGWKTYEARLQKRVLAFLGIRVEEIPQHIRDLVKLADDRMLEAERFVFFGVAPSEKHQDVTTFSINPWSVTWARSKFLKVYEELTAGVA